MAARSPPVTFENEQMVQSPASTRLHTSNSQCLSQLRCVARVNRSAHGHAALHFVVLSAQLVAAGHPVSEGRVGVQCKRHRKHTNADTTKHTQTPRIKTQNATSHYFRASLLPAIDAPCRAKVVLLMLRRLLLLLLCELRACLHPSIERVLFQDIFYASDKRNGWNVQAFHRPTSSAHLSWGLKNDACFMYEDSHVYARSQHEGVSPRHGCLRHRS